MKRKIKSKLNPRIAVIVANALSLVLLVTANTASTFINYDPPQPKALSKFKKIK